MTTNHGWVSVGIDHDTAQFATATLRRWWQAMGSQLYPQAETLLVTADRGGSNSRRSRLWKVALQSVADAIGLPISVCHFPPGTSKWNRLNIGCFATSPKIPVGVRCAASNDFNLIANTTTTTGLQIQAELDTHPYPTGLKVSDKELAEVQLTKATFHGEWNYTISPR